MTRKCNKIQEIFRRSLRSRNYMRFQGNVKEILYGSYKNLV